MFVILMKCDAADSKPLEKPYPVAVNVDDISTVHDCAGRIGKVRVIMRGDDPAVIVALGTLERFKECLGSLSEGVGSLRGYAEL